MIRPTSSNSSLRSFVRTSPVRSPSRSSQSSVSSNSAPRGTAMTRPVGSRSPPQALLGGQRLVQLLDLEREADGRQLPPELAQQMVVASSAPDRHADAPGHRPRTRRRCSSPARARGRGRRSPARRRRRRAARGLARSPGDGVGDRSRRAVQHVRPAAQLRHARAAARSSARRSRARASAFSRPTKSPWPSSPSSRGAQLRRHGERLHQRRIQRGVAEPHSVALQAGAVERAAEHGQRLRRPGRRGRADQLDPGLQELARLAALRAHAPVAVREIGESQRQLARLVARRHKSRDRHRHVRSQHQHLTVFIENAIGRSGAAERTARDHGLVLERRRVHLAVAGRG